MRESAPDPEAADREVVFEAREMSVYYGTFRAVRHVELDVRKGEITAFIGPPGCGKSTVLRCFNRMNDLIEGARMEGSLTYHGVDLYGRDVDPVEVRRRVGMVFQKPNPFPKTIYDNIAFGPRIGGREEEVTARRHRRALLEGRGALGGGQGSPAHLRAWASPAVSSNVSASREPSRSSPTSS